MPVMAVALKLSGQSLVKPAEITYTDDIKATRKTEIAFNKTGNNFFENFAGGINTLFSENGTGVSLDLSSYTVHYLIVLKQTQQKIRIKQNGNTYKDAVQEKYKGIDFYLINRTSINFDSLKTVANDYISSLQASPLTLRFDKVFYLTKTTEQSETNALPVVTFKQTIDGRGIPYNENGKISIGASVNAYSTFSVNLKTVQINDDGTVTNKGSIYFEPSVGFAYGTDSMMRTVFTDAHNKLLVTGELRFGFTSDEKEISDWGFILRYSFSDIIGPRFRAGIAISPDLNK